MASESPDGTVRLKSPGAGPDVWARGMVSR